MRELRDAAAELRDARVGLVERRARPLVGGRAVAPEPLAVRLGLAPPRVELGEARLGRDAQRFLLRLVFGLAFVGRGLELVPLLG